MTCEGNFSWHMGGLERLRRARVPLALNHHHHPPFPDSEAASAGVSKHAGSSGR